MLTLGNKNYKIDVNVTETSAAVDGGFFGEVRLLHGELFSMRIKNVQTEESTVVTSENQWEKVSVSENDGSVDLVFKNPEGIKNIIVTVTAKHDSNGVRWVVDVANDSDVYTVMETTYPTPKMAGDYLNYFIPYKAGVVIPDATNKVSSAGHYYPHWGFCMQFFAVYGKQNGIYIGIEDGEAASKRFTYESGNGKCKLKAEFFGIGASLPANSFTFWGFTVYCR